MSGDDVREGSPKAPTYKAPEDTSWYHFLHGNVPGYQIDFMYRPEVPQGLLTRQHFGHLSRLIKYIEPHTNNPYAFAIGNLSRDDVQHEPGHGGIALIFGFRIEGVTDHAGRRDPPFAHGIATIDRHLDSSMLLSVARSFYGHLFSRSRHENPSTVLYQEYVRVAAKSPEALPTVLKAYVEDFSDLPIPQRSSISLKWLADETALPKRVVIVHPNDTPFEVLAKCASRIAAMLYQSDIKWSAITNGRESDLPNGISIRLVAKRDESMHESGGLVLPIGEVPEEEAEIAARVFKAQPAQRLETAAPAQGWRARLRAQSGSTSAPPPPMRIDDGRGTAVSLESTGPNSRRDQDLFDESHSERGGAVPAPSSNREVDRATRARTDRSQEPRSEAVETTSRMRTTDGAELPVRMETADQPVGSVSSGKGDARFGVDSENGAVAIGGEKLNESTSPATSRRSRAWIWIGLALLCAAAVPVAFLALREQETRPGPKSVDSVALPLRPQVPSPQPPTTPSSGSSADGLTAPHNMGSSGGSPTTDATTPTPEATMIRPKSPKSSTTGKPTSKDPERTPQQEPSISTGEPSSQASSPKPATSKPANSVFDAPLAPLPP